MSYTASSMSRLVTLDAGFRTTVAVITWNWLDCYAKSNVAVLPCPNTNSFAKLARKHFLRF